jgi:hypothetical protein
LNFNKNPRLSYPKQEASSDVVPSHWTGARRKLASAGETPPTERYSLSSASHRTVTVVTVVTLIFTPMLKGHRWKNVLTGKTTDTQTVQCASHHPCPKHKRIVRKIILPKP